MINTDNQIYKILKATDFRFKKGLGQNFIFDKNLLSAIIADSNITKDDVVVEIGTGAGTLTVELSKVAKKVYSFEVDENLKPILEKSLASCENVEVVFKDILRMTKKEFADIVDGEFRVVANLPYYITTPILMYFIESDLPVKSLTVMMQKEVANRLIAKCHTSDYSSITLAVAIEGEARITRGIPKEVFIPQPQVDSALVHIDIDRNKIQPKIKGKVKKLVRASFAMRRKTILNNLANVYNLSKGKISEILIASGIQPIQRAEEISLDEYIRIVNNMGEEK